MLVVVRNIHTGQHVPQSRPCGCAPVCYSVTNRAVGGGMAMREAAELTTDILYGGK